MKPTEGEDGFKRRVHAFVPLAGVADFQELKHNGQTRIRMFRLGSGAGCSMLLALCQSRGGAHLET